MPTHISEMTNAELRRFIIDQMQRIENGGHQEAKDVANVFKNAGVFADMFVGHGEDLPNREVFLWYAGQVVACVERRTWYTINLFINCLDQFVIQRSCD